MTRQGAKGEAHLTYGAGRVRGTSFAPRPDGSVQQFTVDTTIAPGTVDENVAPFVAAGVALVPGQTGRPPGVPPREVGGKVLTFKGGPPRSGTGAPGASPADHVA